MNNQLKKVCVVGLGYIGLPTASLLATKGFDVLGVDVNEAVVNKLNKGMIQIVEPGLDILVKSAVNSKQLSASTKPEAADVFVLAVPTPFTDDYQPDLSYIEAAAKSIAGVLKENDLVILESTSPVGATKFMADIILKERPDLENLYVAHCPERVIPGKVLEELLENDRVIGGLDEASTAKAAEFYHSFVGGKVLSTDAKTAEMCKLTENAFRDVNIAFANELSLICDKLDIDVWELIKLSNHHPRVDILQPGPGVGGHCIAVDPWFIVASAKEEAKLIRKAREVNDFKPQWVISRIKEAASRFKRPVIACLGLTFKADIDDLRESPAKMITEQLIRENFAEVVACEPNITSLPGIDLFPVDEAIARADIVLILVDHMQFKSLDSDHFNEKILIDTKGIIK